VGGPLHWKVGGQHSKTLKFGKGEGYMTPQLLWWRHPCPYLHENRREAYFFSMKEREGYFLRL